MAMKRSAVLAIAIFATIVEGNVLAEVVSFEAREAVGIRRRSDVVSAMLSLNKPVSPQTHFRVLRGAEPLSAQIRRVRTPGRQVETVATYCRHFTSLGCQLCSIFE